MLPDPAVPRIALPCPANPGLAKSGFRRIPPLGIEAKSSPSDRWFHCHAMPHRALPIHAAPKHAPLRRATSGFRRIPPLGIEAK